MIVNKLWMTFAVFALISILIIGITKDNSEMGIIDAIATVTAMISIPGFLITALISIWMR